MEYDFGGWATRNNIKCSDGRTIMKDAFIENDGQKVPLVWNHQHDDPSEVLGHALLENREEGVYAYCKFNDTESGRQAKALVVNGDVDKLSIYANKLKSQMNNVVHGCIREVSLVLAGANPGAFIDSVITHSDESGDEEEAVIYTEEDIEIAHNDESEETKEESVESEEQKEESSTEEETPAEEVPVEEEQKEESTSEEEVKHSDDSETIEDMLADLKEEDKNIIYAVADEVVETGKVNSENKQFVELFQRLTEKQQNAVYALIGAAAEENDKKEGEKETMKHNVFENEEKNETLIHSEFVKSAIADAKKFGSMKESFIAHAEEEGLEWGKDNDFTVLFPDAKNLDREPRLVEKDNSWVGNVMANVKHSPFSRVKSTLGKMNEETARAKGYIKGTKKANIQMALLNRVTTPTTVYIKNDIDRDDVIDITDFDIVAWQKKEMRKLLDRELALAILLGDGRDISDPQKINEQNIRPIITDDDIFTIKYTITEGRDYKQTDNSYSENDSKVKGIIRGALRARKQYKGSGRPTFYTTEDTLTDMLLIEDQNGRVIYDSVEKLATALRVKEIVTVPEMENEAYSDVYGIIVNLADYTAGADKGGSVAMFDDFDIDYNQMKYLIETRMSGALTVPYSAIVLKKASAGNNEQPQG
jgi:HK97 family phage prohead protease